MVFGDIIPMENYGLNVITKMENYMVYMSLIITMKNYGQKVIVKIIKA
jgi:hypothetical protein